MIKKIGQFMPAIFALVALVFLLISASGNDAPAAGDPTPTETAPPTTQATQATQATQTTDAAAEPSDTVEETKPVDARERVEQALVRYPLDETAMAACVHDGDLYADDSTTGAGKSAIGHALARVCDEQKINPIAAFWLLEDQNLYGYTATDEETISVPAFTLDMHSRKEYTMTFDGIRELLTDILTLSGTADDGMPMESKLLGLNGKVDEGQVFHEKGDCIYAYFIYYGERSAHFLCFYARGGLLVEDLEFQLLNLRYASGDEETLDRIDQLGDRQAASIMAAAEQLLSGSSKADEGRIPMSYSVDGYGVAIERFRISRDGETGTLTNYAIRKEG